MNLANITQRVVQDLEYFHRPVVSNYRVEVRILVVLGPLNCKEFRCCYEFVSILNHKIIDYYSCKFSVYFLHFLEILYATVAFEYREVSVEAEVHIVLLEMEISFEQLSILFVAFVMI